MKKHILVSVFLSSIFFTYSVFAQDFSTETKDTQSKVRKMLDSDEDNQIVEAENTFEEANFILEGVDNQDIDLEKYFADGSSPKAEKKSVNVKVQRIEAGKLYESAYTVIYEAYESRLGKLNWEFQEDKEYAKELRQQAADKIAEGNANGDNYRYLESKDLQTYPYYDLQDNIETTNKAFKGAIELQLEAFELYFAQDEKKLTMGEEDFAWNIAAGENTYASYKSYLESQPNGTHVEEAKEKMFALDPSAYQSDYMSDEEIVIPEGVAVETVVEGEVANDVLTGVASNIAQEYEEESYEPEPEIIDEPIVMDEPEPIVEEEVYSTPIVREKAVAAAPVQSVSMPATSGVVYRIQIIAVERGKLSQEFQQKVYSGSEQIMERFEDGMYKYTIGEYSSFSQAKQAKQALNIESFIVAFKNGMRIR